MNTVDVVMWLYLCSIFGSLACSDTLWGLRFGTARYRIILILGPLTGILQLLLLFLIFTSLG